MNKNAYYNPPPPGIGILCTSSDTYDCIQYPHFHTDYELTIIISGSHALILENETLVLKPGSVVLLRPNEAHSRKMETLGRHITIAFAPAEVDAMLKFLGDGLPLDALNDEHPPRGTLPPTEVETCIRRIEQINLYCAAAPLRARAELRVLLVDLFFYYLSGTGATVKARMPWFIKLLKEMEKPENIRLGLPALLSQSPYSHEYLCREFKRVLGCTPTGYVNNARLDLAHKLLEDAGKDIVDICYAVGFESVSYFYSLFKAKYGTSPDRYRKTRYAASPGIPPEQFRERIQ